MRDRDGRDLSGWATSGKMTEPPLALAIAFHAWLSQHHEGLSETSRQQLLTAAPTGEAVLGLLSIVGAALPFPPPAGPRSPVYGPDPLTLLVGDKRAAALEAGRAKSRYVPLTRVQDDASTTAAGGPVVDRLRSLGVVVAVVGDPKPSVLRTHRTVVHVNADGLRVFTLAPQAQSIQLTGVVLCFPTQTLRWPGPGMDIYNAIVLMEQINDAYRVTNGTFYQPLGPQPYMENVDSLWGRIFADARVDRTLRKRFVVWVEQDQRTAENVQVLRHGTLLDFYRYAAPYLTSAVGGPLLGLMAASTASTKADTLSALATAFVNHLQAQLEHGADAAGWAYVPPGLSGKALTTWALRVFQHSAAGTSDGTTQPLRVGWADDATAAEEDVDVPDLSTSLTEGAVAGETSRATEPVVEAPAKEVDVTAAIQTSRLALIRMVARRNADVSAAYQEYLSAMLTVDSPKERSSVRQHAEVRAAQAIGKAMLTLEMMNEGPRAVLTKLFGAATPPWRWMMDGVTDVWVCDVDAGYTFTPYPGSTLGRLVRGDQRMAEVLPPMEAKAAITLVNQWWLSGESSEGEKLGKMPLLDQYLLQLKLPPLAAGAQRKNLERVVDYGPGWRGPAHTTLEAMVAAGHTYVEHEIDKIPTPSRAKMNAMDGDQQDAFLEKQRRAGKVTEALLKDSTGYVVLTTTEAAYVRWLTSRASRGADVPPVATGDRVAITVQGEDVVGVVKHVKKDGTITVDVSGQHSNEDGRALDYGEAPKDRGWERPEGPKDRSWEDMPARSAQSTQSPGLVHVRFLPPTGEHLEKYGETFLRGDFLQHTPLYRVIDGEELKSILESGKIRGGAFSDGAERDHGAQWSFSLDDVVSWGKSWKERLGPDLFVIEINGKNKSFGILGSRALLEESKAQGPTYVSANMCNTSLGCSVRATIHDVVRWYIVCDKGAKAVTRDQIETAARLLEIKPRRWTVYTQVLLDRPPDRLRLALAYLVAYGTAREGRTRDELEAYADRHLNHTHDMGSAALLKAVLKVANLSGRQWHVNPDVASAGASVGVDGQRSFTLLFRAHVVTAMGTSYSVRNVDLDLKGMEVYMPALKRWLGAWHGDVKIPAAGALAKSKRGGDSYVDRSPSDVRRVVETQPTGGVRGGPTPVAPGTRSVQVDQIPLGGFSAVQQALGATAQRSGDKFFAVLTPDGVNGLRQALLALGGGRIETRDEHGLVRTWTAEDGWQTAGVVKVEPAVEAATPLAGEAATPADDQSTLLPQTMDFDDARIPQEQFTPILAPEPIRGVVSPEEHAEIAALIRRAQAGDLSVIGRKGYARTMGELSAMRAFVRKMNRRLDGEEATQLKQALMWLKRRKTLTPTEAPLPPETLAFIFSRYLPGWEMREDPVALRMWPGGDKDSRTVEGHVQGHLEYAAEQALGQRRSLNHPSVISAGNSRLSVPEVWFAWAPSDFPEDIATLAPKDFVGRFIQPYTGGPIDIGVLYLDGASGEPKPAQQRRFRNKTDAYYPGYDVRLQIKTAYVPFRSWTITAPDGRKATLTAPVYKAEEGPTEIQYPVTKTSWKPLYDIGFGEAVSTAIELAEVDAGALPTAKHTTNTAICPVCFGYWARVGGALNMAQHRYRRPGWGYNVSPCMGSGYPQWQDSSAGTQHAYEEYMRDARRLLDRLQDLQRDPTRHAFRLIVGVVDDKGDRVLERNPFLAARYGPYMVEVFRVEHGHPRWPKLYDIELQSVQESADSALRAAALYRHCVQLWPALHPAVPTVFNAPADVRAEVQRLLDVELVPSWRVTRTDENGAANAEGSSPVGGHQRLVVFTRVGGGTWTMSATGTQLDTTRRSTLEDAQRAVTPWLLGTGEWPVGGGGGGGNGGGGDDTPKIADPAPLVGGPVGLLKAVDGLGRRLVGVYKTAGGLIGAEIRQSDSPRETTYSYKGTWGAGSGHSLADMAEILRGMLSGRRGVQVVMDFHKTTAPTSLVPEGHFDASEHETVLTYAIIFLTEKKLSTPKAAAERTVESLNGVENMFISSSKVIYIDPVRLEAAIWRHIEDHAIGLLAHLKKRTYAPGMSAELFNLSKKGEADLRARVEARVGKLVDDDAITADVESPAPETFKMNLSWDREMGGHWSGLDGPLTVAEVRLGTGGWFWTGTVKAKGVWTSPAGPFNTDTEAIAAADANFPPGWRTGIDDAVLDLPDLSYANLQDGQVVDTEQPYTASGVTFDAAKGVGRIPNNQEINYRGFVLWLRPSEFLKLTPKMEQTPEKAQAWRDSLTRGVRVGPPMLRVELQNPERVFRIVGHEGRHRMEAIRVRNDAPVPVQVFPSGGRAQPFELFDFSITRLAGEQPSLLDSLGETLGPLTVWAVDRKLHKVPAAVDPRVAEMSEGGQAKVGEPVWAPTSLDRKGDPDAISGTSADGQRVATLMRDTSRRWLVRAPMGLGGREASATYVSLAAAKEGVGYWLRTGRSGTEPSWERAERQNGVQAGIGAAHDSIASATLSRDFNESVEDYYTREPAVKARVDAAKAYISAKTGKPVTPVTTTPAMPTTPAPAETTTTIHPLWRLPPAQALARFFDYPVDLSALPAALWPTQDRAGMFTGRVQDLPTLQTVLGVFGHTPSHELAIQILDAFGLSSRTVPVDFFTEGYHTVVLGMCRELQQKDHTSNMRAGVWTQWAPYAALGLLGAKGAAADALYRTFLIEPGVGKLVWSREAVRAAFHLRRVLITRLGAATPPPSTKLFQELLLDGTPATPCPFRSNAHRQTLIAEAADARTAATRERIVAKALADYPALIEDGRVAKLADGMQWWFKKKSVIAVPMSPDVFSRLIAKLYDAAPGLDHLEQVFTTASGSAGWAGEPFDRLLDSLSLRLARPDMVERYPDYLRKLPGAPA